MKLSLKRFLSFVLSICMIFSCTAIASAAETEAMDEMTAGTVTVSATNVALTKSDAAQTANITLFIDKNIVVGGLAVYYKMTVASSDVQLGVGVPGNGLSGSPTSQGMSVTNGNGTYMSYDASVGGYVICTVPVTIAAGAEGKYTVEFYDIDMSDVDNGAGYTLKSSSVTADIDVSTPVDTSNPKFTVYYDITGGADTDTDNFKEFDPQAEVAVDVYVKADSQQVMQAFDIYPEWDTTGLTYKSITPADGFTIVDKMSATDPHFQTDLITNAVSTDKTVGTDGVKVATMTFTLSEDAVHDTGYSIWLDGMTNLAKQKDAESVKNVAVTAEGEMGVETLKKYTVSYNANGGTGAPAAQDKLHNKPLTLSSTVPTLDGYKFAGWLGNDSKTYQAGTSYKTNADLTLTAQWEVDAVNYTVKHLQQNVDGNGYTEVETQTLSGKTGELTNAVAKTYEGFTAQAVTQATIKADGSTVVEIKYDRNEYTINFDSNGGSTVDAITAKYGAAITVPAKPTKTGYVFEKWSSEIPATMPVGGLSVTANWTPITYTVVYEGNGNTAGEMPNSTHTYDAAQKLTTNAFSKTGYTFAGWNTQADGNGTTYANEAEVKNLASTNVEVKLYAQWTANNYTVKFDANGGNGTMEDQPFTYDTEQALNENKFTPTDETFVFAGWAETADGEVVYNDKNAVKNLTADADGVVTLYAVWKQDVYAITYKSNPADIGMNTTGLDATYSSEDGYEITVEPTATGYTFQNWTTETAGVTVSDDGKTVTIPKNHTGAVELVANFKINQYTITFNTDGGTDVAAITKDYGATVGEVTAPTKTGYTFAGWDKQIPATMPAENMTITASWTINQYTITFDTAGGTAIAPITQDYSTNVTAPADPTKTGYTFAGWDTAIPATMPAENLTITATWTENTYGITFDKSDVNVEYEDTVEDKSDVKFTDEVTLPTKDEVTKPGYELTGWTTVQNGDKDYEPGAKVSGLTADADGKVTLYPVWKEATYELSFDLGEHPAANATTPDAIDVTYNGTYPELPAVEAAPGYEFKGWFIDVSDENTKIENGAAVAITADTKLTAKYEAIKYTITFNTNGGTAIAPVEYTVESTYALPVATDNGLYTFKNWLITETDNAEGWALNAEIEKDTPVTGHYGNVTLTAQWDISFIYRIEEYKYAPTGYVMLRIATDGNTNGYSFDGAEMFYTDDVNYKIDGKAVFVTLIPSNGNVADGKLTTAAMKKIEPTGEAAVVIDRDGKINKDDVVNIADANAVYQMIVNDGGYYSLEQLDIQARLEADMSTATTNGDFRGTIGDVHEIVKIINGD